MEPTDKMIDAGRVAARPWSWTGVDELPNKAYKRIFRAMEAAKDDGLAKENAKLREAGGYVLGWHPTDPEHPAFYETQEYGMKMMAELLAPPEDSK